ncbi:hypothetical protein GGI43DRAFT_404703 [Trichoderma evansii]
MWRFEISEEIVAEALLVASVLLQALCAFNSKPRHTCTNSMYTAYYNILRCIRCLREYITMYDSYLGHADVGWRIICKLGPLMVQATMPS